MFGLFDSRIIQINGGSVRLVQGFYFCSCSLSTAVCKALLLAFSWGVLVCLCVWVLTETTFKLILKKSKKSFKKDLTSKCFYGILRTVKGGD